MFYGLIYMKHLQGLPVPADNEFPVRLTLPPYLSVLEPGLVPSRLPDYLTSAVKRYVIFRDPFSIKQRQDPYEVTQSIPLLDNINYQMNNLTAVPPFQHSNT